MHRRAITSLLATTLYTLLALSNPSRADADFLVYNAQYTVYGGVTHRFHDDGTPSNIVYPYPRAPNGGDIIDFSFAFGHTHALTANGMTAFNLFDTAYVPYNAHTGGPQYQVTQQTFPTGTIYFASGYVDPGNTTPPPDRAEFLDRVGSMDLPDNGELFTLLPSLIGEPQTIVRREMPSGDVLETIPSPPSRTVLDLALGGDGALYTAGAGGIYKSLRSATPVPVIVFDPPSFTLRTYPTELLLTSAAASEIAFGPNGNLFALSIDVVGNSMRTVDEYDPLTGAHLRTAFTTNEPILSMAFAPDGDLSLLSLTPAPSGGFPSSKLIRVDPQTGTVKSTVVFGRPGQVFGSLIMLPVPEPSGCVLALGATTLVARRGRARPKG